MARLSASLSLAILLCAATAAFGGERGAPRAVIELFTSQGCSSCPPADRLMGEFAKDPSLVAMSLPIDYWDYLGWKDTLAKPRHSARQRAYAQVRGDRQVYTPQVVVNGVVHVLGSDRAAIEGAILQTQRRPEVLSLPVTLSVVNGQLSVTVAASNNKHSSGEIWLCALAKRIPVTIGRGENRGRTISYYNVVRRWVKVGDWTGTARSWSVPTADFAAGGVDTIAAIVQSNAGGGPGKMLGAALASIR